MKSALEINLQNSKSRLIGLPGSLTKRVMDIGDSLEKKVTTNRMSRSSLIVILFLSVLGILMVTSAWDDSVIYDELEHVTAGYSYLKTGDGWLNVWHPPLIKDVAALPLLFANLHDPFRLSCWYSHRKREVIDRFFFQLGNDAQTIIRIARIPMILGALLFLGYFYLRVRREYGESVALPSLLLLGASPSVIAHARFVHSDVPATAMFFVSICAFVEFLRKPSKKTFFIAAACTSIGLLTKASLTVLFPFYLMASLAWVLVGFSNEAKGKDRIFLLRRFGLYTAGILGIFLIGVIVIVAVYQAHIQNMSPWFQKSYNDICFKRHQDALLPKMITAGGEAPATRGISWYMTGVLAQTFHLLDGHEGPSNLFDRFYFGGRPWYFPVLLVTKEPLGSLGMVAFAMFAIGWVLWKARSSIKTKDLIRKNFLAVAGLIFVLFYTCIAASTNLNIGFRHFLPILPFMYVGVCLIVVRWLNKYAPNNSRLYLLAKILPVLTCLSAICAWPGYLSYFNEMAGSTERGYLIALDSNYDWGTDLLRLKNYVRAHGEKFVYMQYYDHGHDRLYMGDVAKPLKFDAPLASGQLIAVPASRWRKILQDSRADAITINSRQFPTIDDPGMMNWFLNLKPVGKAGESIMLFKSP
jgi:hypothetical protein